MSVNDSQGKIPVILPTAKDTIQDKEEGYISGADSYHSGIVIVSFIVLRYLSFACFSFVKKY
jgi:hypothetical protein